MKQVIGTALLHFVKTIRSDKTGIFDKYLTKDDLAVINQKILPTIWYPYDTFKHCFNAVFEVIAKKDTNMVQDWGKLYGEMIMTDVYKKTIKKGNPLEHLRRVPVYIKSFFDFGQSEANVEKPNQVILEFSDYDPDFAPLYFFIYGWLKRMAELCDAQNVECSFIDKSWLKKSNNTSYLITWS
jgi:hypothetical protein